MTTVANDRFGQFGGRYVPETLIPAIEELERSYEEARRDPSYMSELNTMLKTYVGRPSELSDARLRTASSQAHLTAPVN